MGRSFLWRPGNLPSYASWLNILVRCLPTISFLSNAGAISVIAIRSLCTLPVFARKSRKIQPDPPTLQQCGALVTVLKECHNHETTSYAPLSSSGFSTDCCRGNPLGMRYQYGSQLQYHPGSAR